MLQGIRLKCIAACALKKRVAKAIQRACEGLAQLTVLLMCPLDPSTSIPAWVLDQQEKARTSPVSIEHHFGDSTPAQKLAALPLATLSLSFLYSELVGHRLWNALFERGGGGCPGGPPVRTLATRHLSAPATDGWNVVAGATELAHAWGFQGMELPVDLEPDVDLPRHTRMRLAVCLSVAWKFERQLASHFPRRFYDDDNPSLPSPHTHELAYVGYAFMTDEERQDFGGWREGNLQSIRALYYQMMTMELSLLTSVSVMALLTRNAQVVAEERIQALFDERVVGADEAMAIRALVPFFVVASQDGRSGRPTGGALACASMLCVRSTKAWLEQGRDEECELVMRSVFSPHERRAARALLHHGRFPKALPSATLALGCYNDRAWAAHECVHAMTLERAYATAELVV